MEMFGKIACFVVLCMVVVAPHAEAIMTCGQVASSFAPCIPYLMNRGPLGGCCNGVKGILNHAHATVDRQIACTCLKSMVSSCTGLDLGKTATLPITCGVNIPFKISPSTDCSKIHWAYAGSSEAS